MSSTDRVAIFIDGGYIRAVLRKYYGGRKIDFQKLSDALCGSCERFRTYYYMAPPYQSERSTPDENRRKADYDRFIENLKRLPRFMVREGYLQKRSLPRCDKCGSSQFPVCSQCGIPLPFKPFEQKGVDVRLSIDLTQISAAKRIDRAIILSADGDFSPAIEQAKENMVIVTWAYFPQQRSRILDSICDERIIIDADFVNRIALV
jgi:uncharacterized LabA/DUF88 family protein